MPELTLVPSLAPSEVSMLTATMTPEERGIIVELLDSNRNAREVIPDDITTGDLWTTLSATCKALNRITYAMSTLKPYLGRMLVLAQARPEIYQERGYNTFNDFMTQGIPKMFGVSRPEAFAAKRVSEELGDRLSPQEMNQIGFSKLSMTATAIRKRIDQGVPPEIREREINNMIEAAKGNNVLQLRERFENNRIAEPGELEMTAHTLYLTKPARDRWMEFRKQDYVRAKTGGTTDSVIITSMMEECSTWEQEWQSEQEKD